MTDDKLKPTQAEFWSRVDRRSADECWLWTGTTNSKGYAMLSTKRGSHVALEIDGRPRPLGKIALHSCDNPLCVNPNHLRWGTDADNAADMVLRKRHHASRKTHCINGHGLSGSNLYVRPNGQRSCKACQNVNLQRYRQGKRSAQHG